MTTVGEILKTAREKRKLTLAQVENSLKIRVKFLSAIEDNDFNKLPPGAFAKGFIKNYAAFLNLPINDTLAFYRRQALEKIPPVAPEQNNPPSNKFAFTPQLIAPLSISLLLCLFFAYLIFAYFRYTGSPMLAVSSPNNNSVIHNEQVEVIGKTDPDAILTINNESVSLAENGRFSVKITLQPGFNALTIIATNKFHRQSQIVRNLRLEK